MPLILEKLCSPRLAQKVRALLRSWTWSLNRLEERNPFWTALCADPQAIEVDIECYKEIRGSIRDVIANGKNVQPVTNAILADLRQVLGFSPYETNCSASLNNSIGYAMSALDISTEKAILQTGIARLLAENFGKGLSRDAIIIRILTMLDDPDIFAGVLNELDRDQTVILLQKIEKVNYTKNAHTLTKMLRQNGSQAENPRIQAEKLQAIRPLLQATVTKLLSQSQHRKLPS